MTVRFWQTCSMSGTHDRPKLPESFASGDETPQLPAAEHGVPTAKPEPEIGGRKGPDPVRYGDWEKAGRCIDF
jgi:hypothetical protein